MLEAEVEVATKTFDEVYVTVECYIFLMLLFFYICLELLTDTENNVEVLSKI